MAKLKEKKLILKDEKDRDPLGEGRTYGLGFAFSKRDNNVIETAYPISPCREYLNDSLYSELTGKKVTIYGLKAFKQNLLDTENNKFYLVMAIMEKKNGKNYSEYVHYKRDLDNLESNYHNLQKFINKFEQKLNVDGETEIIKLEENRFVCISPIYWSKWTYLISLYTLLLRVGFFYKNGDIIEYLNNYDYCDEDRYQIKGVIDKIVKMFDIKTDDLPKQNFEEIKNPHSLGIVNQVI